MRPLIGIVDSFLANTRVGVSNIPQLKRGKVVPVVAPVKDFLTDVRNILLEFFRKQ